nr:immunoglobulin heavy chain junction region [Mus musculus]
CARITLTTVDFMDYW